MFRRFVALGLVGLFLAMSFVVAEDSIGSYNPLVDINKDGNVDVMDLVEVGQAYGSQFTPATEPNITVVTVLQHTSNLSYTPVQDAIVAVFTVGIYYPGTSDPYSFTSFTNSSGIVKFGLSGNISYIVMAWDSNRTRYNYANITTNASGEGSVVVWLDHIASPSAQPQPIQAYPEGWTVILFIDKNTNKPMVERPRLAKLLKLTFYNVTYPDWANITASVNGSFIMNRYTEGILGYYFLGDPLFVGRGYGPNTDFLFYNSGGVCFTYHTDDNGGAYVEFAY